jgi:N-acetylglucosaminyldiphosphoundecaprenol N-acetyl-beta-D-mannosaminyltransferase
MPLVWLGRLHGKQVTRVCGPEFMQAFCASASPGGIRHFFYGGRNGLAERLIAKLRLQNPSLQVAGCYAPPFRAISPEEDALIVNRINDSGADIVWVSLGCPKQEIWIHEHRDKLNAPVLIAVGLAFDVIAGDKARAPEILRNCGLEWLYRLMQEPARLGVRYLKSNSVFLYALPEYVLTAQNPISVKPVIPHEMSLCRLAYPMLHRLKSDTQRSLYSIAPDHSLSFAISY